MNNAEIMKKLMEYNDYEKFLKEKYEYNQTFYKGELPEDIKINIMRWRQDGKSAASHNSTKKHGFEEYAENDFIFDQFNAMLVKHQRYSFPNEHTHEFFETVYVLDGECINTVQGEELHMKTGDICLLPPGVLHKLSVNTDSIILNLLLRSSTFIESFSQLLNNDSIISEYFHDILYGNKYKKYLYFQANGNKKLDDIILAMYKEQLERDCKYSDIYYRDIMNGYVQVFFGKLLQLYESTVIFPDDYIIEINLIPKILKFIEDNCVTINLDECAANFHYNAHYLSTLLKKHTNQTFIQLLNKFRTEKAEKLLLNTDLSIETISEQVGFDYATYFMRVFKKINYCTPSEYRQKLSPV